MGSVSFLSATKKLRKSLVERFFTLYWIIPRVVSNLVSTQGGNDSLYTYDIYKNLYTYMIH